MKRQRALDLLKKWEIPIIALCFFASGYLVHDIAARFSQTFGLLSQAHGILLRQYVWPLPEPLVLQRGMISGMLSVLDDPYTVYVEPDQHEIQSDALAGQFGGIGVRLLFDEEGQIILVPFPEGPAASAGILDGDILLSVDGTPVNAEQQTDHIVALLRGDIGTQVELTIKRQGTGDEPLSFSVERARIDEPSLQYFQLPGEPAVGVIDLNIFTGQTPDELQRAYESLSAAGVTALILDLRGNGGGLLDEGIAVADFFLDEGTIVIERDRNLEEHPSRATAGDAGEHIPLVLLVDGQSASATEIVAAALQANGRGSILGEETFGKGSVQSIYELQDDSSIHVTTAEWLTPTGETIEGFGIDPDVVLDLVTLSEDSLLTLAVELLMEN